MAAFRLVIRIVGDIRVVVVFRTLRVCGILGYMAHNVIIFPAWRIELPEQADAPAGDDFLAGLRELRAELAECSRDLANVRAGVAEVQRDLDGLIEQVAEATSLGRGCGGPTGCVDPECKCDCWYWDSGCEHPLTPEETARLGTWDGTCSCGFGA